LASRLGNLKKGEIIGNVDIMRAFYDAIGRGDIEGLLSTFDPQIEWQEAEGSPFQPDGIAWIGGTAIIENGFAQIGSDWDGFIVSPMAFHDAGDVVVVEVRYTGTHKATGLGLNAQACHVCNLRDGKVTRFQEYTDTAQLQDVMGARTPAGEPAGAAPA
jgi:ketosteroid isomerase-like protein